MQSVLELTARVVYDPLLQVVAGLCLIGYLVALAGEMLAKLTQDEA